MGKKESEVGYLLTGKSVIRTHIRKKLFPISTGYTVLMGTFYGSTFIEVLSDIIKISHGLIHFSLLDCGNKFLNDRIFCILFIKNSMR